MKREDSEIYDKYGNQIKSKLSIPLQKCPSCYEIIGAMAGSRDAICNNCGFKDPCCGD